MEKYTKADVGTYLWKIEDYLISDFPEVWELQPLIDEMYELAKSLGYDDDDEDNLLAIREWQARTAGDFTSFEEYESAWQAWVIDYLHTFLTLRVAEYPYSICRDNVGFFIGHNKFLDFLDQSMWV